jgi:hypothetical protein
MKTDLKKLRDYKMLWSNLKPRDIKGYRVIFEELPDVEFFVHHENEYTSFWNLSEKKTGMSIPGITAMTAKEAMTQGYEIIKERGIDRLREVIKQMIEQHGEL